MSTTMLWSEHVLAKTPLELALVEAELGSRGETTRGASGYSFLGEKTVGAYNKPLYPRLQEEKSDVDCSDFKSSAAAQKFFLANGGPVSDSHGLDGDGDGLACEWGSYLKKSALKAKNLRASNRRTVRAASRCYTGPRGGTYTITSGGNKNYSGC